MGDEAERNPLSQRAIIGHETINDFVKRAVSSDTNNLIRSVQDGKAGKSGCVSSSSCQETAKGSESFVSQGTDMGPLSSYSPVRGMRIYNEGSLVRQVFLPFINQARGKPSNSRASLLRKAVWIASSAIQQADAKGNGPNIQVPVLPIRTT